MTVLTVVSQYPPTGFRTWVGCISRYGGMMNLQIRRLYIEPDGSIRVGSTVYPVRGASVEVAINKGLERFRNWLHAVGFRVENEGGDAVLAIITHSKRDLVRVFYPAENMVRTWEG